MSLENAKEYLKKYNLEDKIIVFKESCATVKDAADTIGCKEEEIAKSITFLIDEKPILIIASGNSKIDNSKYKQEFHIKAKMIPYNEVEGFIGHATGGVCPFGIKDDVIVYLDNSLKKYETIYPACGDSNSVVKLTLEELEKTSNYKKWIDVCK